MRRAIRAAGLALPGLLPATPGFAHSVVAGYDPFPGGLLHPLLVPAHLMALVALGLMLGTQGARASIRLLAVFALSLAAAILMVAAALSPREPALVLSVCTLGAGAVAAAGRPLPFPATALLAGVGAIALLLDSVPAILSKSETLIALGGTVLSACGVLIAVAGLALLARRPWQRIAVRIAGSWCAASALLVLAATLAR